MSSRQPINIALLACAMGVAVAGPDMVYAHGVHAQWDEPHSTTRIIVTPKDTEVYVDGGFVGIADDFDGMFQGLRLDPGPHEITLYLNGYRSIQQKLNLNAGATYKIRHAMVANAPGQAHDPRPVPPPQPPPSARQARPPLDADDDRDAPPPPPRIDPGRRPRRGELPPRPRDSRQAGHLLIRVQPAGAHVAIDGEWWETSDQERLEIAVPSGEHTIEVRKDGYRSYVSTIVVPPGETVPLNVSLPRSTP